MDTDILQMIKQEIEKIETFPGFGEVVIKIQNGRVKIIQPTPTIMLDEIKRFNPRPRTGSDLTKLKGCVILK